MDSLFTYRDEIEGKVGIGRLPNDLQAILDDISNEYYSIIPDKNASTYHTWYEDMPPSIKSKIEQIQTHNFWDKLCDGSKRCVKNSANEMDELYYSNPKNNLDKINLYGASSNYDIHKDCFFNFHGINFYRIIIGLTDGNDNIITYFNNLNVGHKINSGDYIVFDFDKSTHQVIKDKEKLTPRILLKIHYIVCENCKYSKEYVETIKKLYLYYEVITRYFTKVGTDPETLYQFFCGLFCQYIYSYYIKYIILFIIITTIIAIKFLFKIKLVYKNISKIIKYLLLSLTSVYLLVVIFYWLRYQLLGIR
jgi:uncharacterized cysteine cluster protein YcgN (CxxCxxCC family)